MLRSVMTSQTNAMQPIKVILIQRLTALCGCSTESSHYFRRIINHIVHSCECSLHFWFVVKFFIRTMFVTYWQNKIIQLIHWKKLIFKTENQSQPVIVAVNHKITKKLLEYFIYVEEQFVTCVAKTQAPSSDKLIMNRCISRFVDRDFRHRSRYSYSSRWRQETRSPRSPQMCRHLSVREAIIDKMLLSRASEYVICRGAACVLSR